MYDPDPGVQLGVAGMRLFLAVHQGGSLNGELLPGHDPRHSVVAGHLFHASHSTRANAQMLPRGAPDGQEVELVLIGDLGPIPETHQPFRRPDRC